jgi:hypothetical protein
MEFTTHSIAKMSLEILLGVSIKLLCDNGRIHWRDFVNDFVYAIPGFHHLQKAADGLTRQVATEVPATQGADVRTTTAAA